MAYAHLSSQSTQEVADFLRKSLANRNWNIASIKTPEKIAIDRQGHMRVEATIEYESPSRGEVLNMNLTEFAVADGCTIMSMKRVKRGDGAAVMVFRLMLYLYGTSTKEKDLASFRVENTTRDFLGHDLSTTLERRAILSAIEERREARVKALSLYEQGLKALRGEEE